jgi:hypothetical protein
MTTKRTHRIASIPGDGIGKEVIPEALRGMVGVVGAPDARTAGERLVAFVVPRPGEMVDAAEISGTAADG